MARARPRHWAEDHVGEVKLSVEAPTLAALFEESGRALAELSADVRPGATLHDEQRVEIRAKDAEALLVAWLNELIFRSETQKLVFDAIRVDHVDASSLDAVIRGRQPEAARTSVKAATMHDARIAADPGGFAATVILDV